MRIVSLEPYLSELVLRFGAGDHLVAVGETSSYPEELSTFPKLATGCEPGKFVWTTQIESALIDLEPDVVLFQAKSEAVLSETLDVTARIAEVLGKPVKIRSFEPRSLEQIYQTLQDVAKLLGNRAEGITLVNKLKAQFLSWGDSFYDRMKNKRVTFLSSVEPLMLAGDWIPDLVSLTSSTAQNFASGGEDVPVEWSDIQDFRPDVIIVAPRGVPVEDARKSFLMLEKLPNWEEIPAVKRGDVIFTGGQRNFYTPTSALFPSQGILVSAVAGLESGYITERDSFFKLRWLEMQRHRL